MFPMMMIGLIRAVVLLQAPTWRIAQRVRTVVAVGIVGALAGFFTAVGLKVVPDKPLLLLYAFLATQVFGLLMVGLTPLLKQFFLPFAMTFSIVLGVPSSGGAVTPDLLPPVFRLLSDGMPLAQLVSLARSVAYFGDRSIAHPTIVLLFGLVVAIRVAVTVARRVSRVTARTAEPTEHPAIQAAA